MQYLLSEIWRILIRKNQLGEMVQMILILTKFRNIVSPKNWTLICLGYVVDKQIMSGEYELTRGSRVQLIILIVALVVAPLLSLIFYTEYCAYEEISLTEEYQIENIEENFIRIYKGEGAVVGAIPLPLLVILTIKVLLVILIWKIDLYLVIENKITRVLKCIKESILYKRTKSALCIIATFINEEFQKTFFTKEAKISKIAAFFLIVYITLILLKLSLVILAIVVASINILEFGTKENSRARDILKIGIGVGTYLTICAIGVAFGATMLAKHIIELQLAELRARYPLGLDLGPLWHDHRTVNIHVQEIGVVINWPIGARYRVADIHFVEYPHRLPRRFICIQFPTENHYFTIKERAHRGWWIDESPRPLFLDIMKLSGRYDTSVLSDKSLRLMFSRTR